jgi:ribosome-associated translation inhibitor RaiA
MTYPITVNFHQMDRSEALETMLRERAEKLAHMSTAITACNITVEPEGRHQHQGRKYAVRLDIHIKGKRLEVNRIAHEDAFVAGRDAFDAAKRAVDALVEQQRDHGRPVQS